MIVSEGVTIHGVCGCIVSMRLKYEPRVSMGRGGMNKDFTYQTWKEVICTNHREELECKMVTALKEDFPK